MEMISDRKYLEQLDEAVEELTERIRKLEAKEALDEWTKHNDLWDSAIEALGLSDEPELADEMPSDLEELELPLAYAPDTQAAYVEQIELGINPFGAYFVRLRFDDDTTEGLGEFSLHSTANEYARKQCRRYHVALFDSSYEDLVD